MPYFDEPVTSIGYQWCYQCNSYKDALCADPFYYTVGDGTKRMNAHTFYQACPKDDTDAGMKQICTKVSQHGKHYILNL